MKNRKGLLDLAVTKLEEEDVGKYLRMRDLINTQPLEWKTEFRKLFSSYYRLNAGGITDEFKEEYFKLLFSFVPNNVENQYKKLLVHLHKYPGRNGKRRLDFSFVSKLISIHDESWPIFDVHVRNYFGICVPLIESIEMRIEIFTTHMISLKRVYDEFCHDPGISGTLDQLVAKYPGLEECHDSRKIDFLVWTVGKYKIWESF